ncbi:hypothetical protein K493DRAFT_226154, partial [Basidiobolus meristosporus CBS 931.73]
LPPRNIIPLPEEVVLGEYPEFEVDHVVLALYPNTTCFYKAIVVLPPSKVHFVDCHISIDHPNRSS